MNNYTFSFKSSKKPKEIFDLLLDIKQWWYGIFNETIQGASQQVNDEFTFLAGEGVHYTKQKLIELVPGKKIVWLVTESKLTFLSHPKEWEQTKLIYELNEDSNNQTTVTFTHEGLQPQVECYDSCSSGWTQYMHKLQERLK